MTSLLLSSLSYTFISSTNLHAKVDVKHSHSLPKLLFVTKSNEMKDPPSTCIPHFECIYFLFAIFLFLRSCSVVELGPKTIDQTVKKFLTLNNNNKNAFFHGCNVVCAFIAMG